MTSKGVVFDPTGSRFRPHRGSFSIPQGVVFGPTVGRFRPHWGSFSTPLGVVFDPTGGRFRPHRVSFDFVYIKIVAVYSIGQYTVCLTSIVCVRNLVCILWLVIYPSHSFIDKLHHTALHITIQPHFYTTHLYQTYTHLYHISIPPNHTSTPRIENASSIQSYMDVP